MNLSRRVLLGGAAVTGSIAMTSRLGALAQEGTPMAVEGATPEAVGTTPGYAIARVRQLSSPELTQAIFPHVMHRYMPLIEAVPGYAGYVFAFHNDDPAASITLSLGTDEAAGAAMNEAASGFVGGLDPRFATQTPMAEEGPLRIFQLTDRPASDLPPFLNGCSITMRTRMNAPDADMEEVIATATGGLVPLMMGMDGFVLYAWIQIDGGRVAINIWETEEQLAAGDEAVRDWVAENTIATTVGDPIVNSGTIGYAEIPVLLGAHE
jgi:hypothetical protein